MARKRIVCTDDVLAFAICVIHPDSTTGWLLGGGERGLDVKTYPSKEAAEKAIIQMKKNPHYSWSLPMEAREFLGFGRKNKE